MPHLIPALPGFELLTAISKGFDDWDYEHDPIIAWRMIGLRPLPITVGSEGDMRGSYLQAIRYPDGRVFVPFLDGKICKDADDWLESLNKCAERLRQSEAELERKEFRPTAPERSQ